MKVTKNGLTPMQQAQLELYGSLLAQQQADIDYLSMMTEIEIPTETEEENYADEVQ
nr:MAG TPA: Protein of unknown function (DUF3113) [Caudoviricetes sp.]